MHPDPALLEELVRRIVAVAHPRRIILFGSAARERLRAAHPIYYHAGGDTMITSVWCVMEGGDPVKKRDVVEILRDMPDEIDADKLIYTLYLRRKIELAEATAHDDDVPHDEAERLLDEWLA